MTDKEKEMFIDKDDLTGEAAAIECVELLMNDILDDFFCAHDQNKAYDLEGIRIEFNRYRLYMGMCCDMITNVRKQLHEKGIFCYNKN